MTPETKTKHEIITYLNTLLECWHVAYHTMGYGKRGVPDRLVCYRGRFVALEIKAPGGKPTAWQERCIAEINAAGGVAAVVSSVAEVRKLIEDTDRPFAKVSTRRLLGL